VPEIDDGSVEVKAVARDPGSRAKIAVISRDSSVDPVGACVGMRGSRVQAVVTELQGEKIDIIPWSPDIATFVVNALAPAEVAKVVLDEDKERIEVVVPDQQLSLAIGRRGQNVRLASQLTGWDIDILTEQEESERRQGRVRKPHQGFRRGAQSGRSGRPASGFRRLWLDRRARAGR
jgi:N utilization substance protein A